MPEGLKDAEKCLELDPTFTKGYTRKGAIQFFMKEYDKAMETYQAGLKHDPNNQELLDGVRRYQSLCNTSNLIVQSILHCINSMLTFVFVTFAGVLNRSTRQTEVK